MSLAMVDMERDTRESNTPLDLESVIKCVDLLTNRRNSFTRGLRENPPAYEECVSTPQMASQVRS